QGLSKRVVALMSQEQIRGSPMTMDQGLLTALEHDQAFQKAKSVAQVATSTDWRSNMWHLKTVD
ncbi:hypothetical protein VP01_9470g1, partial [Puccinia sorghi]